MIKSIIGYIATTITTLSLLPQVIKTWKTKSAKDISLWMCVLGILGGFFWFLYGIIIDSSQIILANSIVFVCFLIILIFKIKF